MLNEELSRAQSRDRSRRIKFVAGWAVVLLYCAIVLGDWLPWLRGWRDYPQGWTWATYMAPLGGVAVVALLMLLAAGVIALAEFLSLRSNRRRLVAAGYLICMTVLGYLLQFAFLPLKDSSPVGLLLERVTNRASNGYFTFAASTPSISILLTDYQSVFSTKLCPHCHHHPPGSALFYRLVLEAVSWLPAQAQQSMADWIWPRLGGGPALEQLSSSLNATQLLGALAGGTLEMLIAALVVVPLFGLARRLGKPEYAFRLAALALALPGLLLMVPQLDQSYALLTATALYCVVRALGAAASGSAARWAFAAGATVALGIYFTWAFLPVLLLLTMLGTIYLLAARLSLPIATPRSIPVPRGAWPLAFPVGIILTLALVVWGLGTDMLAIYQYNMSNNELSEALRPYLVWVFFGPLDFLQSLGLPLTLLALVALARPIAPPQNEGPQSDQAPGGLAGRGLALLTRLLSRVDINVFALVFWVVLLAIELAGRNKAEQARALILLMPFALSAVYFQVGRNRFGRAAITNLLVAQWVVCLTIGARWLWP